MDNIERYYNQNNERDRLTGPRGELEFVRSQEIILRYLPPAPATIIDIGGAAGRYSCWLARLGHTVHLVDLTPAMVEQARLASAAQPDHPLASCRVGDARSLDLPDNFADAILLFGPMYHLTTRADRLLALRSALRVLKPGGVLLAAYISRFASALDGLKSRYVHDPEFRKIALQDLRDGQHRNHTDNIRYFTDSYFHLPDEIRSELVEAGLAHEATLTVEGIGYMLTNIEEYWADDSDREVLFAILRSLESEPSLVGASAHLIGVARRRN